MKSSTPKTELPPSTQLRKAVSGGSRKLDHTMNPFLEHQAFLTRRQFFGRGAVGLGTAALASLATVQSAELRTDHAPKKTYEPAKERTPVIERYEAMRYGMFIHFDVSTFQDKLFFCGTMKDPAPAAETYRPANLDVDQWIRVAKEAGMRYVVLTVKHWQGLALWDSKYTDYDVASSGNKTDVVAEFVKACRKYEIAPCLYYLFDVDVAHRRDKGMSEDQWYQHANNQITELLTNYGPITVFWIDRGGAGDCTQQRIQKAYDTVKSLQPDCLVMVNHGRSDGSHLLHWPTDLISGERTMPPQKGHNPWMEHEGKTYYIPMEVCDTSAVGTFSKGWFWEPGEQIKEVKRELSRLYEEVTGRKANLLLNVAVNREGKVPAATVERLLELGKAIKK